MAEESMVKIDPKGNLILEALTDESKIKKFRVCSRALRRQSPVWERMLFGPWKESKPTDKKEWVVQLLDDPAHPLEIVLSIIHGKFDGVPPSPSLQTIHQLVVMANKYDITSIARPWCTNWLHVASNSNLPPTDVVKSLYVAWELGDEHLFALRLEEISLNTEIDSTGRLIYAKTIVLETEDFLGPLNALGKFRVRLTIK
ncbi:hypothetical protein N0V85_000795 [Neurospora sp. IMI 360204]|nr:hypothetical protein N0V85_000795 [Neurospora sp. IMI 360204]